MHRVAPTYLPLIRSIWGRKTILIHTGLDCASCSEMLTLLPFRSNSAVRSVREVQHACSVDLPCLRNSWLIEPYIESLLTSQTAVHQFRPSIIPLFLISVYFRHLQARWQLALRHKFRLRPAFVIFEYLFTRFTRSNSSLDNNQNPSYWPSPTMAYGALGTCSQSSGSEASRNTSTSG